MLWSVAIFGMATILFGIGNVNCFATCFAISFWFWLAFAARAGGRVDNVSVVVRQTLVQILTPDEKRGRVSAVNSLFIGTSNELGEFDRAWSPGCLRPVLGNTTRPARLFPS